MQTVSDNYGYIAASKSGINAVDEDVQPFTLNNDDVRNIGHELVLTS